MSDKGKVIIIEDEAPYAQTLSQMLAMLGYEPHIAEHPTQAIKLIEQAHNDNAPFTIATIDKNYRGGDGHQFALGEMFIPEVKRDYPYLATIMITADPDEPNEILRLRDECDVDQYLNKADGMKPRMLERAIERAIQRVQDRIDRLDLPYITNTPPQYNKPDHLTIKPIFGLPNETASTKCDIFMIMSFNQSYYHIWNQYIQPTLRSMDLDIKRGDDFMSRNDILHEIWSAIYTARFVIADLTNNNPNVFYELAIAHTLGKPAILLAQNGYEIPFDIKMRRVLYYEDSENGLLKLANDLHRSVHLLLREIHE